MDEAFIIDVNGDVEGADKLANDMVHIAKSIGCSKTDFKWGTYTENMNGGSDKDLWNFLVSIFKVATQT